MSPVFAPWDTSTEMPSFLPDYLHVAGMPFPAPQGTQAAVHAMVLAHHRGTRGAHLLTYGARFAHREIPYPCHRIKDSPALSSFRSGPSLRKVVLDIRLAKRLRELHGALRPRWVIAHHVEACAAAIAARANPVLFFAHTALGPELPSYAPDWMPPPLLAKAGNIADRALCSRVEAVAAISPHLAADFTGRFGVKAHYVPLPWELPTLTDEETRKVARSTWSYRPSDPVLLYAGNLDAYQGWEDIMLAMAHLSNPQLQLLVATESNPGPLWTLGRQLGLADRVQVCSVRRESDRVRAHAACDLALIPRRTAGGLPIKLLDAMSRARPIVAVRRATAGLPIGDAVWLADDDSPRSLARTIQIAIEEKEERTRRAHLGRSYMESEHSDAAFADAILRATDITVLS